MDPKTGRCAILFPHGVLFRDEEQEMRRCIVEADLIEAVIGLGPNLFYNAPMESCIVICRSKKPAKRSGRVLFIDAVNEVTRERAQSFLTDDHIDRIVQTYQSFDPEPGFAMAETLDAIAERNSNLSIPLYVTRDNDRADLDLDQSIVDWRQSASGLRSAAEDLFERLYVGADS
jgi:type I restriction enzyme M protein